LSNVSAQQVKTLREKTGAGLMECKKALVDAAGDLEEAVTILRKRGQAAAQKKAGRTTSEGLIGSYVHGGKIGVLIEVNCETDFVAKTPEFQELVKDLAMQVAAASPAQARFVRREEVPEEVLAKEGEISRGQAAASGKPAQVVDKIVEGKLGKFYSEVVLLEQPFIRNQEITVQQHITSMIAILKENIQVRRFARFERGEPI